MSLAPWSRYVFDGEFAIGCIGHLGLVGLQSGLKYQSITVARTAAVVSRDTLSRSHDYWRIGVAVVRGDDAHFRLSHCKTDQHCTFGCWSLSKSRFGQV